jgi:DNA replication protein DnaC
MSDIFNEVLREYERDRLNSQKAARGRRNLLYERLPRIKEIDKELAQIALDLTKAVLQRRDLSESRQSENQPTKAEAYKTESAKLEKERAALLYANGYEEGFLEDVYKCSACKDMGFIENERCFCLKQRLISRSFEMSNLGKVFERENFDSFNINYYSDAFDPAYGLVPRENMAHIWKTVLKFVENFGKHYENLLFHGDTGLGKTFLTNCIAQELLNKGHTVLYATAAQLFKQVEDARFNREKKFGGLSLQAAFEVDLLIIDDLGTEFITSVTNSELFNFINTRLLDRKPTIISTNMDIEDLKKTYTERISSRIYGEYKLLHFIGDDIRTRKKHGG